MALWPPRILLFMLMDRSISLSSNSKPRTTGKEGPTEPFKRAVSSCLRAFARQPELEVNFAAERPVGVALGEHADDRSGHAERLER